MKHPVVYIKPKCKKKSCEILAKLYGFTFEANVVTFERYVKPL